MDLQFDGAAAAAAYQPPSRVSSLRRQRAVRSQPQLTWSDYIRSHAPTLLIGLGVTAFAGYLLYRTIHMRDLPQRRGGGRKGGGKGKKLRNLGLSDLAPSHQRKHGLILDDPNGPPRTPVGLRNVGNSCFLNALLQALQGSQPFLNYIVRLQAIGTELGKMSNERMSEAFRGDSSSSLSDGGAVYAAKEQIRSAHEFLTSLISLLAPSPSSSSSGLLDPGQFYNLLLSSSRAGRMRSERGQQQDAHELFMLLIDLLDMHAQRIHACQERVKSVVASKRGLEELLERTPSPATGDAPSTPDPSPSPSPSPSGSSSSSFSPLHPLSSPAFTFPVDPFAGLQASFLVCATCHCSSNPIQQHAPFTSLTLNFEEFRSIIHQNGPNSLDRPDLTVEGMLRSFVRSERVDGVRCKNCNEGERRRQIRDLLQAADNMVVKGPKGARKKKALIALLEDAEKEVFARLLLLQPTSAEYIRRQRQAEQDQQTAMAPTLPSSSPSPSPPPRAASSSPSSSSSSPSSVSFSEFFDSLSAQLTDESFCATIPDTFIERLSNMCSIDTKRTFSKGVSLARIPPSICLHLNRLMGGPQAKVGVHVPFPMRLNMQPYTVRATHAEMAAHALSTAGLNAAKWNGFNSARVASSMDPSDPHVRPYLYDLDAVVVHQGGGAGGHYIAYRRQVLRAAPTEPVVVNATNGAAEVESNQHHPESNGTADQVLNDEPDSVDEEKLGNGHAPSNLVSNGVAPSSNGVSASAAASSPFALDPAASLPLPSADEITWWYTSDHQFREVDVSEVIKAQAYLLIYTQAFPTNTTTNRTE